MHAMRQLLRVIACILLAVAMGSAGLATAAHATVVVDETVKHSQSIISEIPCSDCGSHRLRVCNQSCSASLEPQGPSAPFFGFIEGGMHPPFRAAELHGLSDPPLLIPPIARYVWAA